MNPKRSALFAAALAAVLAAPSALAQTPAAPAPSTLPAYNPLETFAPLALPSPVNSYRSASGEPGPKYWQNHVDYDLHATLDTAAKTLTASEKIEYKNNSPDTLSSLWLNMEQNIYRTDARARAFSPAGRRSTRPDGVLNSTEGFVIDMIEVQRAGLPQGASAEAIKPVTVVSDTRMQVQLPPELYLHRGDELKLTIHYHYTIPGVWGGRTSWGTAKQGDIYDIAQWYPRLCVYDDLHGWDTQPYLGNEFYLEYGSIHYAVTLPANMIVAGSGELLNPDEVLTKDELTRLAEARKSDKTVMIRSAEDAAAAVAEHPTATKTWRFAMSPTRDVSFTASSAFLWDAAKMNIPAGAGHPAHAALAQSVYPAESAGPEAWGRSTEYLKDAIERYSGHWYPYPWPNAINVAGFSTGMEYPGILFDGIQDKGKQLFWITAHEIGHTWFPMIVGSNERRDAWIDEGFNTFIDTLESDEFEGGVYGPKRDGEYAPGGGYPADEIAKVIADPDAPVLLTRADAIREKYRHPITYFKSAFGLTLLREDILGTPTDHARFDFAFRKFIADWAFKHPSPSDFFRTMESEGGEDLSYFWRGWYMHNWQLDMAVTTAEYVDKTDPAKGLNVTLTNRSQLVLPALLRVTLTDGTHIDTHIPAETWLQNASHVFKVATRGPVTMVTLDPDHAIPDADRSNNSVVMAP